ncbi:hypothetical protein PUMCH_004589 [Australozyma saopauloensis]|uniref:CREG-like beta-barrel domain-containing protein n=1 Tax=Australozyma saopauloensis TaxID=291208 RepID=A0AAX4HF51_9ASCO|nr:hypothetical protein PUMCH_004589 [[Candida] saopauloensis]
MKIISAVTLFAAANAAFIDIFHQLSDVGEEKIPSMEEGAVVARTLVNRESMMNVNTISQSGADKGYPKSSVEYYVDCDGDGNPYWLIVDIGSPYRHISQGSRFSVSVRAGDHPQNEKVDDRYPGGVPLSPMGQPRVNLMGELQEIAHDPEVWGKLLRCFIERHPDSKWWLPTNLVLPHRTHWAKIIVHDVYMVGGFGDRAYIGPIDGETYHKARIL